MSKNETYEKINLPDNKNDLVAFLQGCMTENLNHARHIETEIHTFTGIYMAVVAGVLGFGFSISSDWLFPDDTMSVKSTIIAFLNKKRHFYSTFCKNSAYQPKLNKIAFFD